MTERAPPEVPTLIGIQRTEHPVPHRLTCGILGVPESWFHERRDRPISAREVRRGVLADEVRRIFTGSGGLAVSVNTIAKLMAELGLAVRVLRSRRA